jgi:hypothetical protein
VATFTVFEADLLRSLAGQLIELLRNEEATPHTTDELEALLDFSGPTTEPDDPVLARLFPTAYPEDAEAAADFRRFTEASLRNGKADAAALVIDTLEEAGLPDAPEDGLCRRHLEDGAASSTSHVRKGGGRSPPSSPPRRRPHPLQLTRADRRREAAAARVLGSRRVSVLIWDASQ